MTVLGLKNSQIAIERNHVISFVEIPVLGKQINSYKWCILQIVVW